MPLAWTSTSTGTTSAVVFDQPVAKIAIQPTGTATLSVQGSLGGANWFDVMASSTYAAAQLKTSTGNFLVSRARLVITAYGSTVPGIYILGE